MYMCDAISHDAADYNLVSPWTKWDTTICLHMCREGYTYQNTRNQMNLFEHIMLEKARTAGETMCKINSTSSPLLYKILKWTGLVVGCMAKFVTGSLFVFNVYEDAIKQTFNYTEKEMELQPSLLNTGLGFGFLPGIVYDRFGPTWTSLIGLIVSVGSYLLLWGTIKTVEFYRTRSWLMSIYFFLCGIGSVFTYMAALNTNVMNFPSKYRGVIIGLLNACLAGSPSIYAVVFYNILDKGPYPERFGNMMLLFSISFGVVDILCMLFLHVYTNEELDKDGDSSGDNKIESDKSQEVTSVASMKTNNDKCCIVPPEEEDNFEGPLPFLKIIMNPDFQLLVWTFSFASVVSLVFNSNVTVIAKSNHLDGYDSKLVLIIPITNAIVSTVVGGLSDYYRHKIPRIGILNFSCIMFTVCSLIALLLSDKYVFLVIATFFCGVGIGIVWSIAPTIMSEMFHVSNLGRNWGIAIMAGALMGMVAQEVFGVLYDEEIANKNDIYCYGLNCVRGGLAVCVAAGSVSVVLSLILIFKRRCRIRRYNIN